MNSIENVLREEFVKITVSNKDCLVSVEFCPTVPHCTLANMIGLCVRVKLFRCIKRNFKLELRVSPGSHATESESLIPKTDKGVLNTHFSSKIQ